jgi:hypothetical protein
LNPNFVAIKREASVFKNDGSAENFRKIIEASPFASDAAIFNISERAIEVSNIRKPALVMVLSLLLGFLAGCGFVLIGSALKQFGARETI